MSTSTPIVVRKAGTAPPPPPPKDLRGGPRLGAGRKSAALREAIAAVTSGGGPPPELANLSPDELDRVDQAAITLDYASARAKKESWAAAMAELHYKVKAGEYVERAAVQTAVASAMAAMAQTLRSIPDNIERKLGVDPDLAQEVGHLIDEAMDSLADELERMARDGF